MLFSSGRQSDAIPGAPLAAVSPQPAGALVELAAGAAEARAGALRRVTDARGALGRASMDVMGSGASESSLGFVALASGAGVTFGVGVAAAETGSERTLTSGSAAAARVEAGLRSLSSVEANPRQSPRQTKKAMGRPSASGAARRKLLRSSAGTRRRSQGVALFGSHADWSMSLRRSRFA